MQKFNLFTILTLLFLITACGEEVLTRGEADPVTVGASNTVSFENQKCSEMHTEKPPVDILYVIDNSGSTISDEFTSIKSEIAKTVSSISNEFDYHVYFAPLHPLPQDSIQGYPLIVSDPSSLPSIASLNVVSVDSLNMFAQQTGNNAEYGFTRAYNLINYNRDNGIFRDEANTIVVMISNGDDTETKTTIRGNQVTDTAKFNELKLKFQAFTKKYADTNSVSNPMNAETFKFISLVAGENCYDWTKGVNYQKMSQEIFEYLNPTVAYNSNDTVNLCTKNYSSIFTAINNSIRQVIVGHKYDHWKISSASSSQIQEDDIQVTKVDGETGAKTVIPRDSVNGFEYLGHKTNFPIRYEPTVGEEVTGLVVKLNGNAKVEYPDCIIAKTRTPTEYFGYIAVPRDPDLTTVKIEINGVNITQSSSNGWSFIGWRDTLNTKVPGPTGASTTPANNKSGYFFQLNGNAIFTNGDVVNIYYKAKPL